MRAMRAEQFTGYGGLKLVDLPKPGVADGKVLVRITAAGVKPALIFADGGSPVAVVKDAWLYYVSNDERMTPGGMHLSRVSTSGETMRVAAELEKITEELGITGLTDGPDGTVYVLQCFDQRK